MARLPPTRKYRKRKPGRDRPLPPPGKGELRIRQVRSGIGRPAFERRTPEALGLKHHQAVVVKQDRPARRGMLDQGRHLVVAKPAKAKAGEEARGKPRAEATARPTPKAPRKGT